MGSVQNAEFLLRIWEQLYLVFLALAIALLLGVPLGLAIANRPYLKKIFLSIAQVFQTIPSLALLALLLPVLGIGIGPAIVALSIYALLPIVQNTVSGVEQLPRELLDAAYSLGLTRWQRLKWVEIPLGLPIMMAGIRTATAMCVGVATLAAFIGAGGLGVFIYQGLSLTNPKLVLWGAIPAALLALVLDYCLLKIEKRIRLPKSKRKPIPYFKVLIAVGALLIIGIGSSILFKSKAETIVIGSKDFTEQYIIAEIMAEWIENKTPIKVIRRFNLGGTWFCHEALLRGDIDLYAEYTSTAYQVILNHEGKKSNDGVYSMVKSEYEEKYNATWLKPFGFNNTQTVIVTSDQARKNQLKNISDLKFFASKSVLGAPPDCVERKDCWLALVNNGIYFKSVSSIATNLLYKALLENKVDAMIGFATDGRLMNGNFISLKDDNHTFTGYFAAPVIRDATLKKYPFLRDLLNQLAGQIDDKTMRELNYEVDVLKRSPQTVAHEFLKANQLIS